MRYMFLIYTQEDAVRRASVEEMNAVKQRHGALLAETAQLGILQSAAPLQTTETATTVRHGPSKLLTTDGPFAETKEQLAGYYILECKDLDEAIAWAAKIPTECGGGSGCVEIRPIREMPNGG